MRFTNRVKMWRFVWNLLVIVIFESGISLANKLQLDSRRGKAIVYSGYVVSLKQSETDRKQDTGIGLASGLSVIATVAML